MRPALQLCCATSCSHRLADMGDAPDHQRAGGGSARHPWCAARAGAAPGGAGAGARGSPRRRGVRTGERICRDAPATPGVYVLKDADDRPLYVGKAVNLRRRLRAHFAERRWRAMKPEMSRIADAEWQEVGSELEALLREAALIHELQPSVNVQIGAPALETREIPRALVRDVLVLVPSIEARFGGARRRARRRRVDDSADAPQRRRPRGPRAARRCGSSVCAAAARIDATRRSRRLCFPGWRAAVRPRRGSIPTMSATRASCAPAGGAAARRAAVPRAPRRRQTGFRRSASLC